MTSRSVGWDSVGGPFGSRYGFFAVMRGDVVRAEIGVIGGSGLYQMEGLHDLDEVELQTPYGKPSDAIVLGTLEGVRLAFLPRHGRGHRLSPSELPYRANIVALKMLGVRQIVSASAVGSLKEELRPMDMVVPDQLYDRTKARPSTLFGDGVVAHIAFAHPFCARMSEALCRASESVVARTHAGGTYLCIEGPAFSTYAESVTYRRLGFDVIGMTALPEAKLAREAEMCYTILAQVTDYDCWHEDVQAVTAEMVMLNVARNAANARAIISRLVPALGYPGGCSCQRALEGAIATAPEAMSAAARARLQLLLARDRADDSGPNVSNQETIGGCEERL